MAKAKIHRILDPSSHPAIRCYFVKCSGCRHYFFILDIALAYCFDENGTHVCNYMAARCGPCGGDKSAWLGLRHHQGYCNNHPELGHPKVEVAKGEGVRALKAMVLYPITPKTRKSLTVLKGGLR